jgi:cobalt-zinc-cadmium efflux system outer membrane protein
VKPRAVSTSLFALILVAFYTQARAQQFAPDDLPLEGPPRLAAENAAPPADEPLPDPQASVEAEPSEKPKDPVPLPPVNEKADDRLTLTEAQTLALSYHPALRETMGRLRAARGNWLQVGLKPNPILGYAGEEMGDAGTAGKQGGFISQQFVTAGKLGLNRAVASREVAAAEQRAEITRLQVLTTVRMYYFEMLAAERGVVLANQLLGIAEESVRVSEGRLQALDIPRVTLLQSQVEREATSLLAVQATERRNAAWRQLATAIGVNDPHPVLLDDTLVQPLPEFKWDTTRERVLADSPELSALRLEVDRARYQLRRAAIERVPDVTVQAGAQHDNVTKDNIANVQVSVPLPIFDRNQGGVAAASGELTAARAALQQKELDLEQRLAAALRDYSTARERAIRYADKVLPTARETLQMMNAGYQDGELDYLQVLSIQQTYAQQNLSYLKDVETAWKKWAEIDGLLVGPLSERTAVDGEK